MSAFTVAIRGKADIGLCAAHVCFLPKADIARAQLSVFGKLALQLITKRTRPNLAMPVEAANLLLDILFKFSSRLGWEVRR